MLAVDIDDAGDAADEDVWEVVEMLEEESKAYPPTPAAITIITIAMTTETVLLIA